MADLPRVGQGTIPLSEWRRFVRVADWWDRTFGFTQGVIPEIPTGDLIVKTPADGIPARSGTTIYSAMCDLYIEIESGTAGQMTLAALAPGGAAQQVRVYNLSNAAVGELRFVTVSLTQRGTRYVVLESCTAEA